MEAQKKVLSLVLCVAMMLSVMVVGAGAAFSDQSKIKNTEAVDACTALNIIGGYPDGSFKPEGNITRAEVTKMICVALNGGKEPNLATNATPTFSDVRTNANSAWAEKYIESCYAQGIVSGVGAGKFAPAGNVTGTQLAKMLLVSLGYKSENEGFTGNAWATNVNVRASQKGLYDGLESMDPAAALTRDSAAQMIWNALNAYEVEYVTNLIADKDGKLSTQITVQDKIDISSKERITLLEDKYEAKTFTGTFDGNSDVCNLDDGEIQVTGSTGSVDSREDKDPAHFKYNFDLKYIGEEVKVLFKDATGGTKDVPDTKDTIYGVYVTGETKVYNITKNDLQNQKEAGTVRFGDKNYDVADGLVSGNVNVVINYNYGADTKSVKENASLNGATYDLTSADGLADYFQATLKKTSADTIKFICNSKGKIEKAYVVETKLARVTAVSSDKVSINNGVGSIKIEDNEIYKGVAKDDIVAVTTLYNSDATNSNAYSIVKKAETVSGKLTSFKGIEKVSLDNKSYDIAQLASKSVDSDFESSFANQLDETYTLYLIGGLVYAAEQTSDGAKNYAVVEGNNDGNLDTGFNPLEVKIMKADGTEGKYVLHKDSKVATAGAAVTKNDVVAGTLIKYTETSNGKIKITEVHKPATTSIAAAETATVKTVYNEKTKTFTYSDGSAVVSADAVLFVNKSGEFTKYTARNLDTITVTGNATASSSDAVTYDTSVILDDGKVVAAYVTLSSKPNSSSSDTVYGIVSSENGDVKVNGDTYTSYTVDLDESTQKTVMIEGSGDTSLKEGDLVAFDVSADNIYSSSNIKVYARYAKTEGNNEATLNVNVANCTGAVAAYVDEYDEQGKILSYYTNVSQDSSSNTYVGSDLVTKAVDKDVKVIYVNSSDDKAGSNIGVNEFDAVKGHKNIVVVFDNDNENNEIVAIFVDSDSNLEQ